MASFTEISITQFMKLVGLPDSPLLLDVRIDADVAADPDLIPGAVRVPHTDMAQTLRLAEGRRTVVYCQKGLKLSQGVAAMLREASHSAEALAGGHFAWRDAGLPRVPLGVLPPPDADGRTVWVTRNRPKIDRMACPWLIRRFVDPRARFLFVPGEHVLGVADKFGATPFDLDGVAWSHVGEYCTFDTMLDRFGLRFEALDCLARIVRAADTDRLDLAPQAAGLLAASLGLSRMIRDDDRQLEAGFLLYDAFYRWARDAQGEAHNWPGPGGVGGTA